MTKFTLMSEKNGDFVDRLNIKSQEIRGIVLKPILTLMDKIGLTANRITNLRLLLGIIFLIWFFNTDEYLLPSIFILFVLFLDVFDGALARYQKRQSDRGKFLDVFVDNAVYIFIILAFLKLEADVFHIAYNIFIIPTVYLLATIKNQEFKPSDWIIKTYPKLTYLKIITTVPFFLYVFIDLNWLDLALIVDNVLATLTALYCYAFIQLRWRKKYKKP